MPAMLASVDWTHVLIALIGSIPGILAVVFTWLIRRDVHTANGESIGQVADRVGSESTTNLALTQEVHDAVIPAPEHT